MHLILGKNLINLFNKQIDFAFLYNILYKSTCLHLFLDNNCCIKINFIIWRGNSLDKSFFPILYFNCPMKAQEVYVKTKI